MNDGSLRSRVSGSGSVGGGGGGGGSVVGGGDDDMDEDYMPEEEIQHLRQLCENANEDDEDTWDAVRHWLSTHSADEARQAAEKTGEYNTTSLHLACRNCPPADVVDVLLSAAPTTVELTDSFGWLPLHYACANGASEDVLRILAEAFPESKTATDRRGRTPLHFALGNTDRPATPSAVVLLSSTGAAACADENGMLPLHYACAYGASEEALHVLTDGNVNSIIATDRKGRTPLHFALGNAERPASPAVVRLLLSQNPDIVNSIDNEGSQLPLHLLATRAHALKPDQMAERENAQKCLDLYLNAEPKPTADFLTALQSLPDWLSDRAVVAPVVQSLLNEKISQRFPTAVILLDFYFLCAIIITFSVTTKEAIDRRFDDDRDDAVPGTRLILLYIGALYFLVREVVQMLSLLSLGLFQTWLYDPTNWLDVTFIFLVLFWTLRMHTGAGDHERFRTAAALSLSILWINVLMFLKSMFIDFAVFVGGVLYVVQRLVAFLMALIVILVAFTQMFVTIFRETPFCNQYDPINQTVTEIDAEGNIVDQYPEYRPWCEGYWAAFLKVYTMLLGEVDENDFNGYIFATILFVIFMFLVVILLANVLIAIVTDSYGVIKNERAAIVFWSNRLDFVAEMDAISNGPWKGKLKKICCRCLGKPHNDSLHHVQSSGRNKNTSAAPARDSSYDVWKKLMELFEDDIHELHFMSLEFWCYLLLRIIIAAVIIPLWVGLGVLSAGWLWPPQLRSGFLVQRISKRNSEDLKEVEYRRKEVMTLRAEVKDMQGEMISSMAVDRKEMMLMKSQLVDMKSEVTNEMKEIKQIMTMLFDSYAAEG